MSNLQDRIRKLADEFERWDTAQLDDFREMLSGIYDSGELFPPYIPFVGRDYEQDKRVLVYATAQNMVPGDPYATNYKTWSKRALIERLYYSWDRTRQHPNNVVGFSELLINPYQAGVLPALAGVFLHTKFGETIPGLPQIHDRIAVSNWYKFSLHDDGRNLNPPDLPVELRHRYEKLNDCLVLMEVEALRPTHVIVAFKSRTYAVLSNVILGSELIQVHDPAWLFHSGRPEPERPLRQSIVDLVSEYVAQFLDNYDPDNTQNKYTSGEMRIHVKNYLLYWAEQFGGETTEEDNDV